MVPGPPVRGQGPVEASYGGRVADGARAAAGRLPRAPGVYRFRDPRGTVLYVGRAVDLRRRVASYWSDLGERAHLAPMVRRVAGVEALVCDSAHEAAWLERNLLERRLPPWNRSRGGQEVPVWVRLDDGGVSVVHDPPSQGFGPYLGGARVRTAVGALRRVLPVDALARARGLTPADPSALAAVLRREPAAVAGVRTELERRRDGAAERMAFEAAARLQAELEAFDWLVAEQKVTVTGPVDLDVYGWQAGILVHLGVRAGRLCEWEQSRRPRPAPLLAATPDAWRPFADRAATTAAILTAPG
jgi:excinuclease ABC subunit C